MIMLLKYASFCVPNCVPVPTSSKIFATRMHRAHNIFVDHRFALLSQIVERDFWAELALKPKVSGENESEHSELCPSSDPETNVYSFGLLLLEIISGKLPYSKEQGPLLSWVSFISISSI